MLVSEDQYPSCAHPRFFRWRGCVYRSAHYSTASAGPAGWPQYMGEPWDGLVWGSTCAVSASCTALRATRAPAAAAPRTCVRAPVACGCAGLACPRPQPPLGRGIDPQGGIQGGGPLSTHRLLLFLRQCHAKLLRPKRPQRQASDRKVGERMMPSGEPLYSCHPLGPPLRRPPGQQTGSPRSFSLGSPLCGCCSVRCASAYNKGPRCAATTRGTVCHALVFWTWSADDALTAWSCVSSVLLNSTSWSTSE
jgi:hypothetical protein